MDTTVVDGIAAEEVAESADAAAQATAAQQAQEAQQQQENAEGWRQAVRAAGDIVTSALPEAKPVWTRERMDNLGDALARCDEVYGWGGAGNLLTHPLIGLAVAAFPLAFGTVKVVQTINEREASKGAPAVMAKPVPPSEQPDVTLAQPVAA